ncbi:hypothetical protein GCG54_00006573 [Colletotrichum gloeosporioides]|uniref:RNase MRP protein 1 RNA binding domain-containing protein n=1 Tax=Colletotrichum gloeosporioides TaxID=474922 RepID=A0A8H4FQF0_COLGL|nr:uncharacterized protein GCG54_00006573 [Colletotrichum gloeosporioides]KAF3810665.1 hypothetical protein GCG54_00006573 [Colletotrichum gloeosporioides]
MDTSSTGGKSDELITGALIPVLHILDSFNHRNKNQHHVARWWIQFDLLRRAVKRLHDALVLRIQHAQAQGHRMQKQKTSKHKHDLDGDVSTRVETLIDQIIPSSFLAFTQLTADNQHAALGLVLLGVLASINSAVASLVPDCVEEGRHEPPAALSAAQPTAALAKDTKAASGPVDFGIAISRDQLQLATKPQSTLRPGGKEAAKEKKRKVVSPVENAGPMRSLKDKKIEKKPKKKSKKGDEFSDLFSSLM